MNMLAFGVLALCSHLTLQSATPAGETAPPPDRSPGMVPTVSLDPERPFPILGWWSNGTQMIEVAEDGAYRLYDTQNRYRKPIETGRWHRQNHAAFWLEPYTMRKEERSRVPLSIVDGTVVISIRKFKPMTFIEAAPMASEDLFIGLWAGQGGSLDLQASMRYHYVAPKAAAEGMPVVISSHKGEWRLRDGKVELLPDSPSVTAMLLEPQATAETVKAPAKPAAQPTPSGEGATTTQTAVTFSRLLSVEGPLDRVVQRPTVGPAHADEATPKQPAPRVNG